MTEGLRRLPTLKPLILASASQIRREILRRAGLDFETIAANIAEKQIIASLMSDNDVDGADIAQILAESKAQHISEDYSGRVVIGCDQTLVFEGQVLSKSESIGEARQRLIAMRGMSHQLHAALAIVVDTETIWRHVDTVTVTFRSYTPEFVGQYLAACGQTVLETVGGYQLEGLGSQLLARVEGDYFSVLGLPLLPLMDALRLHQVVAE